MFVYTTFKLILLYTYAHIIYFEKSVWDCRIWITLFLLFISFFDFTYTYTKELSAPDSVCILPVSLSGAYFGCYGTFLF